ncbi:UPF0488 protein CG14286 [Calliopsis andreniformis]|uniref:UPF0488 protein CG14286 n=1 Tax=Calliopsis andreniformis TaxID=337506 RepID=UPI003FCCE3E3
MPPKPRRNANKPSTSKKNAEPPKPTTSNANTNINSETTSGLSEEAEGQFQLELCWCIQQLEMCLATGKLPEKQAQDLNKNINILKGNKAPLIKKRQIMRSTLGNYREKMALDEQKLGKAASSMKFVPLPAQNKKCTFVKKAACKSTTEKQCSDSNKDVISPSLNENDVNNANVQTVFKFNFQIAE